MEQIQIPTTPGRGLDFFTPKPPVTPKERETYRCFALDDHDSSCLVTMGAAGVLGIPLGIVFSLMFHHAPVDLQAIERGDSVWKRTMADWKVAAKKGWHNGKNFGAIGFLWGGSECAIEKYRGRTDPWNTLTAGLITGAMLAMRGGPRLMFQGAITFAAFAGVMDAVTGHFGHRPFSWTNLGQ